MLKCKIDRSKGTAWVKTKGTGADITTESLALIREVYRGIKQQNEEAADLYRRTMIGALLDPNSAVWKEGE